MLDENLIMAVQFGEGQILIAYADPRKLSPRGGEDSHLTITDTSEYKEIIQDIQDALREIIDDYYDKLRSRPETLPARRSRIRGVSAVNPLPEPDDE